jgi:hypothetical protein
LLLSSTVVVGVEEPEVEITLHLKVRIGLERSWLG